MKIFAIADMHLDGGAGKPMDIFGPHWANHRERIFGSWQRRVEEDDVVLIPGDICWAMYFEDALSELKAIAALPGKKVMIRGNHDYWWASPTKMRSRLPDSIFIIQNDSLDLGGFTVCGSRGWLLPSDSDFKQDDKKIYERELIRLELSLRSVKRADVPKVCLIHYPPVSSKGDGSGFSELMDKYGVTLCLYGHLHGRSCAQGFNGVINGTEYRLCSADSLGFEPMQIALPQAGIVPESIPVNASAEGTD